MTPVETAFRPAHSVPGTQSGWFPDESEPEPHVWADMTVEVALAVMQGARAGQLVVRDDDGRRTGLVTHAQLTGFRATTAYTDRVRLRDLQRHAPSLSSL